MMMTMMMTDLPEVKHSTCELMRLKKSGFTAAAAADNNKQAAEIKPRGGPATWPGKRLVYSFASHIFTVLSFFCSSLDTVGWVTGRAFGL